MSVIVTAYGNKSSYFVKIWLLGRLSKFLLVINWTVNFFWGGRGGKGGDSLHARLNSHYKAWNYKKKKHKKIQAYRKSV